MRLKIFLLFLSASLVGTGLWLKYQERQEILAAVEAHKRRWVPDFELGAVSEILIKTNQASLLITKDGETWNIQGETPRKADVPSIGRLVQRLKSLKPTEEIEAVPSQYAGFELLEPDGISEGTGTLIEIRDRDSKRLAAIIIGKQSFARPDPKSPFPPAPNGRFFVPASSSASVGVVSEGFDSINTEPDAWAERGVLP